MDGLEGMKDVSRWSAGLGRVRRVRVSLVVPSQSRLWEGQRRAWRELRLGEGRCRESYKAVPLGEETCRDEQAALLTLPLCVLTVEHQSLQTLEQRSGVAVQHLSLTDTAALRDTLALELGRAGAWALQTSRTSLSLGSS